MARVQAWVVYPDRVEKVEIIKRGASERQLVRKIKDPITVEDEEGTRYVVPLDQLYNDPVSASVRQAEYARQFGMRANPAEDEDDDPDSDPDNDEPDDPDDPDDEDELDCGCGEGESCEECEDEDDED